MTNPSVAPDGHQLHADGLLDLEAPIGTYLPTYRPHPKHGHPIMRQLLRHTAGLAHPPPARWVRPESKSADAAWPARVVRKHGKPTHAVGAKAAYSNTGYLLAGGMEAVTGRPVEESVRDLVLRPLGMTATGYG
jgi:CubicO group peptidase (beta-lactamase class C family)